MISKERSTFDPLNEKKYLERFSGEMRRGQLEVEVRTALAELFLSQHSHTYLIRNGELRDEKTGLSFKELSQNGEREKIIEESLLRGEEDLVVSISPRDRENGLEDNMIDIFRRSSGDEVHMFRFKVEMSLEEMVDFERVSKMGGWKLADLMKMMVLAKETEGITLEKIMFLTREMLREFEKEYGSNLYDDAELITRFFVAVRSEVERRKKECPVIERIVAVDPWRMRQYLTQEFKVKIVTGGGACPGSSMKGEFGAIIIIKTADGISFRVGSTEGLNFCAKCGCWYSGDKCPICN
jgi:hypothetical protein